MLRPLSILLISSVCLLSVYTEAQPRKDSLLTALNNAATATDSMVGYFRLGQYHVNYLLEYDKGLEFHNQALKLANRLDSTDRKANILRQTAYIYNAQGDFERALEEYTLVLPLLEQMNDSDGVAELNGYIGGIYEEHGNLPLAISYYKKVYEIERVDSFRNARAESLNAIASMFLLQENYKRGISFLFKAAESFEKNNNYRWSSYNYASLSHACIKIGGYNQALQYAREGLRIAQEHGLRKETYDNYLALSDVYYAMNDYDESLRYYKMFTALKDSIFTVESKNNISRLASLAIAERQEQRIKLLEAKSQYQELQADRQALLTLGLIVVLVLMVILAGVLYNRYRLKQRNNKLLQTSLNEKEVLLKEIHHRVKNNLQLVSSLLNLQSAYIKDTTALEAITNSQSRVNSMALIHQKLFSNSDFSYVEFGDYCSDLLESISASMNIPDKKISITIDIPEVNIDLDTAIPLGLIVNELVTNAFKHAFEDVEKGEVNVSLNVPDKNNYHLVVKDNGKGMPENFDQKSSTSLGLDIVSTLTEQLEGDLKYKVNGGTEFSIDFSVNGNSK